MGQYGLTIGGPIEKDRTFFFISYEGLRQFQGQTVTAVVPTASFLQQALVTGRTDPQRVVLCRRSATDVSRFFRHSPGRSRRERWELARLDSFFPTAFLLSWIPVHSRQRPMKMMFRTSRTCPTTVHEDTWLVRIDHKFSDKTTLYGRAQRDISLVHGPNGNSLDELQTINHPANYFVALQHTFSIEPDQRSESLCKSRAVPQSPGQRSPLLGHHA